jgi:3-dehydroquinate synthase
MIVGEKKVNHSLGSYSICLSDDFKGLKERIESIPSVSNIIIFTERPIAQLYLKYLELELAGIKPSIQIVYLKGGEKNKHIDRVKKAYHQLVDFGADRKSLILALGGGVVGDFAGFIASTYQRGIRFVQIPTTLLAAVDSSVGGKVAVNLNKGKNMVGTFHQPEMVFMPLFTLSTLPKKEWRCGIAEIAKHSLLAGGQMWEDFRSHSYSDMKYDSDILKKMILDSIEFKASIVNQDEKEGGVRQILNLGHTTAHAIESLTKYSKYSHGEAVAIGIITALILSVEILNFPKELLREIITAMVKYDLPIKDSNKAAEIFEHMQHDKKKDGNVLKFVLLQNIGEYKYGVPVEKKDIIQAIKEQVNLI